jgi:hypothetical protein
MRVAWYHRKWFVVLMLLIFSPLGLILLWTSPVTKPSGRIVWTLLCLLSYISWWRLRATVGA